MRLLPILFAISLAACGGKSKPAPAPTEPAPAADCGTTADAITTAEQCSCFGFEVVGDIGDGNVKCPDDTEERARINYGIEGGVCCERVPPAAAP
jgi:hypothetical protein